MTVNQDEQHLQLLSIFHYVLAAVFAFFSCFPVFHLIFGIVALTKPEILEDEMQGAEARVFGLMFTIIPVVIILSGWTFAVCMFFAGRFLARRTRYMFCFVTACISCMFMPLGTALGIFTIVVLVRPSVKAMFHGQASAGLYGRP